MIIKDLYDFIKSLYNDVFAKFMSMETFMLFFILAILIAMFFLIRHYFKKISAKLKELQNCFSNIKIKIPEIKIPEIKIPEPSIYPFFIRKKLFYSGTLKFLKKKFKRLQIDLYPIEQKSFIKIILYRPDYFESGIEQRRNPQKYSVVEGFYCTQCNGIIDIKQIDNENYLYYCNVCNLQSENADPYELIDIIRKRVSS